MLLCLGFFFFFFKQKTAYEMLRSLVGSEMCIRDSARPDRRAHAKTPGWATAFTPFVARIVQNPRPALACLLYTSDAADDLLCVDLGGRRIIKKKKPYIMSHHTTNMQQSNTNHIHIISVHAKAAGT